MRGERAVGVNLSAHVARLTHITISCGPAMVLAPPARRVFQSGGVVISVDGPDADDKT